MVKINKLDSNKRSGISPFLYTPEVFPDDVATQNIETTENSSKLKLKMKVLDGDEVPEQLIIWIKDLEDNVLKNELLKAPAKLAILWRLVDFEAQTILSTVENNYKNIYKEPEDVNLLKIIVSKKRSYPSIQMMLKFEPISVMEEQLLWSNSEWNISFKKLFIESRSKYFVTEDSVFKASFNWNGLLQLWKLNLVAALKPGVMIKMCRKLQMLYYIVG